MYLAPTIESGKGVAKKLRDLTGRVLAVSMDEPWTLFRQMYPWSPDSLYLVPDMDINTVERAARELPPCDVVVGLGGGSCCDMAKYLAWQRGCRMVLAPTIISVDAPLTYTVAVRVSNTVKYVGEIFPRELLIDHALIQAAPPELNRAGACDIASIHTALHDWRLARDRKGEPYDARVADLALGCLQELDTLADEVFKVTSKGIDLVVDLFRREVEFCYRLGNARPEEGSEHIVAYAMEHLTRRHFLHGDLVGLGIYAMSRLQDNEPDWALSLLQRTGLRYTCPYASLGEIRQSLATLLDFKNEAGLFYSIVDERPVTQAYLDETMARLAEARGEA